MEVATTLQVYVVFAEVVLMVVDEQAVIPETPVIAHVAVPVGTAAFAGPDKIAVNVI